MVLWRLNRATNFDRARVITLHEQGLGPNAIARQLNLHRSFVARTISTRAATRSLADRPRSGRPRRLIPSELAQVRRRMELHRGASTRHVAAQISGSSGHSVSHMTICRAVRTMGLHSFHTYGKPALTRPQKAARLAFARDWLDKDTSNWVFYDEASVELRSRPNRRNDVIWATRATLVPPFDSRRSSVKVNIAAAVSSRGAVAFHVFDGIVDTDLYIDIMEREIVPQIRAAHGDNFVLVQDNFSVHASARSQEWLTDNLHRFFGNGQFPAYSPDLNVIENVWSLLKREVRKAAPATKQQLEQTITAAWTSLSADLIGGICRSYRHRLEAVIRARGGSTRY